MYKKVQIIFQTLESSEYHIRSNIIIIKMEFNKHNNYEN